MPSSLGRIAIVEDDDAIRRLLREVFESEGYLVSEARGLQDLMRCLNTYEVSLITLDLMLKSEDGLAIARAVRAKSEIPVIIISAKTSDVEKIVGLELGADDYIAKPFNVREVLARVRAVLRRTARSDRSERPKAETFAFDGYRFDLAQRELRHQDLGAIELTAAEFKLLECFVRRPSRMLSRTAILDWMSGEDDDVLERSVDTLVGRLRRKLQTGSEGPLIKTIRGSGYIFTAKVAC